MDKTVSEQAQELAKAMDFEQRSKDFGQELDALIQKHKVGLILTLKYDDNGIVPQIKRIDMKRIEEEQAKQAGQTKPQAAVEATETKNVKPKKKIKGSN